MFSIACDVRVHYFIDCCLQCRMEDERKKHRRWYLSTTTCDRIRAEWTGGALMVRQAGLEGDFFSWVGYGDGA